MISFLISLAALILGYFIYGKFVEKVFGIDPSRKTPALTQADGVETQSGAISAGQTRLSQSLCSGLRLSIS